METTPLLIQAGQSRPQSFWSRFTLPRFRKREFKPRSIEIGKMPTEVFPPNNVCNQKYNIITFLPLVLYEQFSFFLNLYFLMMALSQFIPSIRIGYLYTYWGPLLFVIGVTIFREFVDDYRRYRRDKQVNQQKYERIVIDMTEEARAYRPFVTEEVCSSQLRVGDIVILHKGQRVPADMILLRTNENMGAVYIRTDQLDGEIDWKLRIPVPSIQKLPGDAHLLNAKATITAEKPEKDIHTFIGSFVRDDDVRPIDLDIDNTLWSGCVIASGQATGLVIYTGIETRSVMNNSAPRVKFGRLDRRVNDFTKVLFVAVVLLSALLIVLKGFNGPWYSFMFRFVLLFSYIIPISLRVNLEMGKVFYSWRIQHDKEIEGTVMRSTNIPEELGRIQYLLTDKTGTLTKNEMVLQKLYFENVLFDSNTFCKIEALLTQYVTRVAEEPSPSPQEERVMSWTESVTPRQAWQFVAAMALCHNVTPVYEVKPRLDDEASDMSGSVMSESGGGVVPQQQLCDYQASSPDEVALVKWTDMMGVALYKRDLYNISLKLRATNQIQGYEILEMFPFTSESKMMGIIVKQEDTEEITYYVKGADVALKTYLDSPSLEAECRNLAAAGLRTMVVAKRTLTQQEYDHFEHKYKEARASKDHRSELLAASMNELHRGLQFLGLTGIEDRLADNVPDTLAKLRKAGIKIWMLTGDKLETALCIARSLQLGGGAGAGGAGAGWHAEPAPPAPGAAPAPAPRCSREQAHAVLERLAARPNIDLIVEGDTLEECLEHYPAETEARLCAGGGVVVARCSPTQKARVVRLLRARGAAVAAVGDGGNDVAMIQEADVGVGIKGLEGRAASLAGDVAARSFGSLARLLLVHGRRAVTRSAALTLFIVHRGLLVSTMQAVFSVVFYFSSVSLYPGFLMIGYGTIYTVLPVFSLVLDKDLPSITVLQYPQLYKQLSKGRQLSYKTFFIWTAISIYQGAVIMYLALLLFEEQLIHIVEISYSALILTELIMVALTIVRWHRLMLVAELLSLSMYTATLLIFTSYFDGDFIRHWEFWWKVTVITVISCVPLYVVKFMHKKWTHRQYRNLVR